jgi:hypothetical protein
MPDNDYKTLPPIQVLAVACASIGEPQLHCAWLHGFALLTLQPTDDDVHVSGMVMTGEQYVDDGVLTTALAEALNPDAILAGIDLTGMMSRLGRLPIEVVDQAPSLALLGKLEAMLENHEPIDLTISMETQVALAVKVYNHRLLFREEPGKQVNRIGLQLFGCPDNFNTNYLAAELTDTAGATALAIGDVYLEAAHRQPLLNAWQRWREDLHGRWQLLPTSIEIQPIS